MNQEFTPAGIIKGVADCTIWDHVAENEPLYRYEIETRFQSSPYEYDPAVVDYVLHEVRKSIVTPMFVEAAKATLHLEEKSGKVYMLASFTDLAV